MVPRRLIHKLFVWPSVSSPVPVLSDQRCKLFVCLNDLPIKGTRQTPTRGYKHQAGNSQSLSQTIFKYALILQSDWQNGVMIKTFI